jgi:hypothetical protein
MPGDEARVSAATILVRGGYHVRPASDAEQALLLHTCQERVLEDGSPKQTPALSEIIDRIR